MDKKTEERIRQADLITEKEFHKKVFIRGIIEFSNYCRKNCRYCGIRRENAGVSRYRMSPDEIVSVAEMNLRKGMKTIVLQSGEDLSYTREVMSDIIRRIKALDPDCAITLSIGERSREDYAAFKEAGADRFLMRFETSDRALFRQLHPDDDFDVRMRALQDLRELGYEVGSGFMIGIPGETADADDRNIDMLEKIGVHMIGTGPFLPAAGTPMENERISADLERCLDVYARIRIRFPKANMAAATALDALDKGGRKLSLAAGANVVMPNTTPLKYRDSYSIYERKGKLDDHMADAEYLGAELERLGYVPMWNERGDSLLVKNNG